MWNPQNIKHYYLKQEYFICLKTFLKENTIIFVAKFQNCYFCLLKFD